MDITLNGPQARIIGLLRVGRVQLTGGRKLSKHSKHYGEDDLTAGELQVLQLIRDGHRNKQIADQLTIAETTVNFHIKNLVDQLQATTGLMLSRLRHDRVCSKSDLEL